jgi:hypothetical protein
VPDVTVIVATIFYLPEFKSSGYSFAFDNNTGEDVTVEVTLTCASR